ncbi:hypothetical protein F4556_003749 [Kitasatospora gansuensis]|uniref:Uncharacterized protein n=1 Tax=Kitasatospora gansuensis TaxID=258050 RepID=A0A7W7SD17_9ACTN|nr:hypothetical protein [Kitasatospora gansuensis]
MSRQSAPGPANARKLLRALTELGAAPVPDPKQRPHGVQSQDAPLLVGVLLAKAELDAAQMTDPDQGPPGGLSDLLAGYQGLARSSDSPETELKLLTFRLIRTASELVLLEDDDPLLDAACNGALAAGNLINCYRLRQYTRGNARAVQQALESADRFTHDLTRAMAQARSRTARIGRSSHLASSMLSATPKSRLGPQQCRVPASGVSRFRWCRQHGLRDRRLHCPHQGRTGKRPLEGHDGEARDVDNGRVRCLA